MARSFSFTAGPQAITPAVTVFQGERLVVNLAGLAPGATAYLTVATTTEAAPALQFEGTTQIVVSPEDVATLDEGRPYYYNIWQELGGDIDLLFTGQFLLNKSIQPNLSPGGNGGPGIGTTADSVTITIDTTATTIDEA